MTLEAYLRRKAATLLGQDFRDRESVVEHFEFDRDSLLVPRDVDGRLEENGDDLTEDEVRAAYDEVIEAVEAGEVEPA